MTDSVIRLLCRTVGCTSVFAHWFQWPHGLVCSRIVLCMIEDKPA